MPRLEVENCRRRRTVHPSAPFAGVHDQRVAPGLHLLLVLGAVHHEAVRQHRALRHVREVVHQQDLVFAELHGVRRLEQLAGQRLRGNRLQPLAVAVGAAEDAHHRRRVVLERLQRERRAVVAGVQHHVHLPLLELLQQPDDRRQPVVRIADETNAHQASFHSRVPASSRTRSSYVSRRVITAQRDPSTSTSGTRGRLL